MGVLFIFADGVALMIGSLLAAAVLTFSAWWFADRIGRPWLALVLLLVTVGAMLVSPLEHSLFVRMLAVFAIVGAGLLYVVGIDVAVLPVTDQEGQPLKVPVKGSSNRP